MRPLPDPAKAVLGPAEEAEILVQSIEWAVVEADAYGTALEQANVFLGYLFCAYCCLVVFLLAMFYGADLCLRYVSSRKSQCSAIAPRHAPAITGSYWYARRMCGRISPATFRLRVLECDFYLTMFASHMIQRSYLIGCPLSLPYALFFFFLENVIFSNTGLFLNMC